MYNWSSCTECIGGSGFTMMPEINLMFSNITEDGGVDRCRHKVDTHTTIAYPFIQILNLGTRALSWTYYPSQFHSASWQLYTSLHIFFWPNVFLERDSDQQPHEQSCAVSNLEEPGYVRSRSNHRRFKKSSIIKNPDSNKQKRLNSTVNPLWSLKYTQHDTIE